MEPKGPTVNVLVAELYVKVAVFVLHPLTIILLEVIDTLMDFSKFPVEA